MAAYLDVSCLGLLSFSVALVWGPKRRSWWLMFRRWSSLSDRVFGLGRSLGSSHSPVESIYFPPGRLRCRSILRVALPGEWNDQSPQAKWRSTFANPAWLRILGRGYDPSAMGESEPSELHWWKKQPFRAKRATWFYRRFWCASQPVPMLFCLSNWKSLKEGGPFCQSCPNLLYVEP